MARAVAASAGLRSRGSRWLHTVRRGGAASSSAGGGEERARRPQPGRGAGGGHRGGGGEKHRVLHARRGRPDPHRQRALAGRRVRLPVAQVVDHEDRRRERPRPHPREHGLRRPARELHVGGAGHGDGAEEDEHEQVPQAVVAEGAAARPYSRSRPGSPPPRSIRSATLPPRRGTPPRPSPGRRRPPLRSGRPAARGGRPGSRAGCRGGPPYPRRGRSRSSRSRSWSRSGSAAPPRAPRGRGPRRNRPPSTPAPRPRGRVRPPPGGCAGGRR